MFSLDLLACGCSPFFSKAVGMTRALSYVHKLAPWSSTQAQPYSSLHSILVLNATDRHLGSSILGSSISLKDSEGVGTEAFLPLMMYAIGPCPSTWEAG